LVLPAFAARTIEVTKDVDVSKTLLAEQLTDLESYTEIFPAFVKSVEVDQNTNRAKFIVETPARSEADVQSTIQPDGTFVVEILSGDLKGSKIVTKLKERIGFDGTPKGATTVTTTLILETSWTVSLALAVVDDNQIRKAIGDGFYDLGNYVKSKHQNEKIVNVDKSKKSNSKTNLAGSAQSQKLEAARELDPQKEAMKTQLDIYQKINEFMSALKNLFTT
jgi:hypothetical protein